MLFALVYLLLRPLVVLVIGSSDSRHNDTGVLVLPPSTGRPQATGGRRPRLRRRDRLFLAVVSRAQKPRIGPVSRFFFEFARPAPPRRPRWGIQTVHLQDVS
jgi:hypothetical protein